ncbi:CDP-glycerol glycerophosphotransferase family protein [Shewanella sp. SP1S1-7]|uniref:CDP-glycerol glycerophosphotransferase family protein n=1 Tax=Shewanella sp. SP1S1-7 TaxID=3063536 RepID=UPI00288EABB1|nr:CDP-glycerol glycerophosphotransferase family protein [Shewanella sp. SP1S1-7]MDT3337521.1 CDP-glycerol glycerophosphotransferase family protein [Shewanella sp. SP1S1-7]
MKTNLFTSLLKKCIYGLSWFFPRQGNKAVFGCYKNLFADNSKYLYLHWHKNKFMHVIWISGDASLVNALRKKGFIAYERWSLEGVYHVLTARFYIYNSYIGDVNQWFASGSIKINLWHGSPLKRIEFDIDHGPLAHKYQSNSYWQKTWHSLLYHQEYVRPQLMLSPSPLVDRLFCSAFRLQKKQLLSCGNPRTDFYRRYPDKCQSINSKPDGTSYKKVILYAPSWRDANLSNTETVQSPYEKAFNWGVLSQFLVNSDCLFLLRLHPNERHYAKHFSAYPNVRDISSWEDVYGILHQVDLLLTDYSSLFIDVLPLNIAIVFYLFDHESYIKNSRNCYEYSQCLPQAGLIAYGFEELINILKNNTSKKQTETLHLAYTQLQKLYWQEMNEHSDCFELLERYICRRNLLKSPLNTQIS